MELFCIAYVIDFVWLVCFLGLTDVLVFMNPLRWLRLRPLSEATATTRARTKATARANAGISPLRAARFGRDDSLVGMRRFVGDAR